VIEIRALHERDNRASFRSGDADLDRFFQQFAGQNQFRHHLGVTYVAVDGQDVLGFVTVAAAHVEIDGLPAAMRRKLPRYPLPVLRLARLAVDRSAQGQGTRPSAPQVRAPARAADGGRLRMRGSHVDAKPDAVAFDAKHGFLAVEAVEGGSEARPAPTPMVLSIRTIRHAMGARL